jgi:hypothetical protein
MIWLSLNISIYIVRFVLKHIDKFITYFTCCIKKKIYVNWFLISCKFMFTSSMVIKIILVICLYLLLITFEKKIYHLLLVNTQTIIWLPWVLFQYVMIREKISFIGISMIIWTKKNMRMSPPTFICWILTLQQITFNQTFRLYPFHNIILFFA